MKNTLILYHKNCPDGFTAAWAAWMKFRDRADYIAVSFHDEEIPDVKGKEVYILDFSYPRDILLGMAKVARSITLLDHHLTAEKNLSSISAQLRDVRRLKLPSGAVAFYDAEDEGIIKSYSWSEAPHGGVIAYAGGGRENSKHVYLHRLILGADESQAVDHINRNPLDNRRANLRLATKQQNAANMDRGNKWKGITKKSGREKWVAQIGVDGENKYLGSFDTPEEAARAYDSAAVEHFGEFARGNFVGPKEPLPPNIDIHFDMDRSGAGMSWDFFHSPDTRPRLINYVEDRDLWRWQLSHSKECNAVITSYEFSFGTWSMLHHRLQHEKRQVIAEGNAILRQKENYVRIMRTKSMRMNILGWEGIPVVNAPHISISELVGALAEEGPFAVGWHYADGKFLYSLRSRGDDGLDVSAVAKYMGGGGHKGAAGFSSDTGPWDLFEVDIKSFYEADQAELGAELVESSPSPEDDIGLAISSEPPAAMLEKKKTDG